MGIRRRLPRLKPDICFIIFCICGVAYLIGWCIMKALVPKYKIINPAK